MKVIYITHYASLYGANRSLLGLITDLQDRYKINAIVLCPSMGELTDALEKESIPYHTYKYYHWQHVTQKKSMLKNFVKRLLNLFLIFPILHYVRELKPDIIHANSSVTDLGFQLARRLRISDVWHLREFGDSDYGMEYVVNKRKQRFEYEHSKQLIAISKAIADHYQSMALNANIEVVYNGVSSSVRTNRQIMYNDILPRFTIKLATIVTERRR